MKVDPKRLVPFVLFLAATALPAAGAAAPATLRLDYYHAGTDKTEDFSFDRLVVEPLPWPGPLTRTIDTLGFGKYFFEVLDEASGKILYSRGFASIYGEWETTGEASRMRRTFHESLRFPAPAPGVKVKIRLSKRDAKNVFQPIWEVPVDPGDILVSTAKPPQQELIELHKSGEAADKLDLLVLGDGYTAAEKGLFLEQARQFKDAFFAVSPFKERKNDFNIWGLVPPAAEQGISRPSTGLHRESPIGATYDAFRSERYMLTFENRRWREVAAWAPYEFVLILANSEVYGGGGIYGLYATSAAGNAWASYVSVHELGHHIAGLADEYYTSEVAYVPGQVAVEPWEANVTALLDRDRLKWADLATPGVPVPMVWPKDQFEGYAAKIQVRRKQIRAENRPESEMSALFAEQAAHETELLGKGPHAGVVSAFEGANYSARGYYRPQADCVMFTRDAVPFCAVCSRALGQVIELYAPQK